MLTLADRIERAEKLRDIRYRGFPVLAHEISALSDEDYEGFIAIMTRISYTQHEEMKRK